MLKLLKGLLDFLKHAFKNTSIEEAIMRKQFWLFSPAPNQVKIWNLIPDTEWETHAPPGMHLGMSLSRKPVNNILWEMLINAKDHAVVQLERPMPLWAPYPEDAEFLIPYDLLRYLKSF
jgi:hypothetical protein